MQYFPVGGISVATKKNQIRHLLYTFVVRALQPNAKRLALCFILAAKVLFKVNRILSLHSLHLTGDCTFDRLQWTGQQIICHDLF